METADERRGLQAELTTLRSMKDKLVAEMQAVIDAHNFPAPKGYAGFRFRRVIHTILNSVRSGISLCFAH